MKSDKELKAQGSTPAPLRSPWSIEGFGVKYAADLWADLHDPRVTPEGRDRIEREWKIFERWLGCEGRAPTADDWEQIDLAWKSYLARAKFPSAEHRQLFDEFARRYNPKRHKQPRKAPSREIISLFDRSLIALKSSEGGKVKETKTNTISKSEIRHFLFFSFIWIVAASYYIFEYGHYGFVTDSEVREISLIIGAPLLVFALWWIYRRFVK